AISPWLGVLVLVLAFLAGGAAVFSLSGLVSSYVPGGSRQLSVDISLSIIENLVNESDQRSARHLPAFVTASGGRGADWMQRLYSSAAFQRSCEVIQTLGPVPCYPAYRLLARQA